MAVPYNISTRSRLLQLAAALKSERSTFDAHWRDLADFLRPRRLRMIGSDRTKGDKRNQKIIDSTGLLATRTLQSGLHAGLTSPARPWFVLSTPDATLNRRPAVKAWLRDVTDRMLSIYQQSNIYNSLPIVYGDMGMFGTAAVAIMEDSKDLFRSYTFPIGSYSLGVNARGIVTTFYREYETTVRQVVEDFGGPNGMRYEGSGAAAIDWSTISSRIKEQWDKGNYESPVEVCWIILPNNDANPNRLESRFKRWASYHYEKAGQPADDVGTGFLRESGFDTFPILAPRWDVTSHEDTYGSDCPGMTALGDVKMLQSQQRNKARAINKVIDPPMVGSNQLRTQTVSILPAAITYEDSTHGQQGFRAAHEVRFDLNHMTADIQDVRQLINEAFYVNLFLAVTSDYRNQRGTAREIDEIHEEKLLGLGPVLERTNDELLDPLTDRTFQMMMTAGLLPDIPEELQGVRLTVEYISILAQAQKLVGVVAQDRFLNSAAALAQTFPDVTDSIDERQVIENYADMLGVDPRILRTREAAQALGDARRQQQAQMMAAEQAKTLAAAGKSAADSPLNNDSVLSALNAQAGGAAQRPTDASVTP